MEIEDEVDLLMSTDILAAQISTKSISFARAQSGWIFREDKKVYHLNFFLSLKYNLMLFDFVIEIKLVYLEKH